MVEGTVLKGSMEKRDAILASAKHEFLRYGYEQASLRDICSKADMTTGALYFYFKNKADLFDTLVRDSAIEMQDMIDSKLNSKFNGDGDNSSSKNDFVEFLYSHKDEIQLLAFHSKGTKYEGYLRRIEDQVTNTIQKFMEEKSGKDINREIAHLISRMQVSCYTTIASKDYTLEQAAELSKNMSAFNSAGINGLLDSLKSE